LDGDDWSFPQRILFQLQRLQDGSDTKAHLAYYLRLTKEGTIMSFKAPGLFCFDGALHKCLASLLIDRRFLMERLGGWDSVRFGADSELYFRLLKIAQASVREDFVPVLLALDREESLTRQPHSILGGSARTSYSENFRKWHESVGAQDLRISFPLPTRPFPAPAEMQVPYDVVSADVVGL
jgi:hypothetical protein